MHGFGPFLFHIRNYALVTLGINSALRISDILSLIFQDVYDFDRGCFKSHILIRECKTGKIKKLLLNGKTLEAFERLFGDRTGIIKQAITFSKAVKGEIDH